jgi:hypothetical protein
MLSRLKCILNGDGRNNQVKKEEEASQVEIQNKGSGEKRTGK